MIFRIAEGEVILLPQYREMLFHSGHHRIFRLRRVDRDLGRAVVAYRLCRLPLLARSFPPGGADSWHRGSLASLAPGICRIASSKRALYAGIASVASAWLMAGLSVGCTTLRPELGSLVPTGCGRTIKTEIGQRAGQRLKAKRMKWVRGHRCIHQRVACKGTNNGLNPGETSRLGPGSHCMKGVVTERTYENEMDS